MSSNLQTQHIGILHLPIGREPVTSPRLLSMEWPAPSSTWVSTRGTSDGPGFIVHHSCGFRPISWPAPSIKLPREPIMHLFQHLSIQLTSIPGVMTAPSGTGLSSTATTEAYLATTPTPAVALAAHRASSSATPHVDLSMYGHEPSAHTPAAVASSVPREFFTFLMTNTECLQGLQSC